MGGRPSGVRRQLLAPSWAWGCCQLMCEAAGGLGGIRSPPTPAVPGERRGTKCCTGSLNLHRRLSKDRVQSHTAIPGPSLRQEGGSSWPPVSRTPVPRQPDLCLLPAVSLTISLQLSIGRFTSVGCNPVDLETLLELGGPWDFTVPKPLSGQPSPF